MTEQTVRGLEAAQLRALAEALTATADDAVVSVALDDRGVVRAEIDHPDDADRSTVVVVDVDATVRTVAGIRRRHR